MNASSTSFAAADRLGWALEFRPLPLLSNPHLQTVLGVYWKGQAFPHHTVRRRVRLPDGDRLVLHDTAPAGWRPTDPVALLVHGLGGSHRSGAIVRTARLLLAPVLAAGVAAPALAQAPANKPAQTAPAKSKPADPKDLLKQGRKALEAMGVEGSTP